MRKNFNNPHGIFANQTGEFNPDYSNIAYFNQIGTTTPPTPKPAACCSCCSWWCSDFAGNLATALGSVGAAALGKPAPKPAAAVAVAPKPPAGPTTKTTPTSTIVLYWSLGIVVVAGVIGTIIYVAKK